MSQCTEESVRKPHNLTFSRNAKLLKDEIKDKERNQAVIQATTFDGPYNWYNLSIAAADIYNGFCFWTVLTSLGVCVWYFPLWHMGISGYEVAVMSTLSPLFLGIPQFRSLAIKYNRWLHYAAVIPGLFAWQITSQEKRLGVVSFSVFTGCLAWTSMWYAERNDAARLQSRILAWTGGLVLSSIAKFACYSNNPLWPIMKAENGGWNWTGLFIAFPAIWHATRPVTTSGGDHITTSSKKGSSLMAGVGIGGMTFAMHSLLSDSSTMISWTWTGFPVNGPQQVPYGAVTIFAMGAGLLFGVSSPKLFGSWTVYGVGSIGAMFLTYYQDWTGFYGGLIFTVYVCGIAPTLIKSAVQHNPAISFGFGFLIYNLMVLFHVWVVAYAFVPGGPLVRERTDWVMIATVLQLGNGVFSALTTNSQSNTKATKSPRGRKQTAYYLHILFALQLLSMSIGYLRFPTNDYKPYHPETKSITAGIWTIHFSLDNDMWSSETRMASAIRELEIDVIGMLESDTQRIIMGNRDTMQYLAEDLGMYVDYGPGPNQHTWGAALLSKFPILNSTHHLLPSPVGELAPAIEATLDVYGTEVDVFVFHSGQEEDPEDRRLQSEYLARIMNASPRPSILLSYLVIKPGEGNYHNYVGPKSGMHDIDHTDWDRWCEYILYKDIKRTGYARVSRGTITDTEIQVSLKTYSYPLMTLDSSANLSLENNQTTVMNRFLKKPFILTSDFQHCSVVKVYVDIGITSLTNQDTLLEQCKPPLYRDRMYNCRRFITCPLHWRGLFVLPREDLHLSALSYRYQPAIASSSSDCRLILRTHTVIQAHKAINDSQVEARFLTSFHLHLIV